MPVYEYRCLDCERTFEALVRTGRDDAECPSCSGTHLTREMSVFASPTTGDGAARAASAIAANGGSRMTSGGGCCGGGCGCH
jgi:putative FmdB family regulatory protein